MAHEIAKKNLGLGRIRRPSWTRGFTVLEILVAMTIFSLVTLSIYAVFHAGIRSQAVGDRETDMIRRARYSMDTIENDMGRVFLRDETSYNVSISRMVERMEAERLEAEETGEWGTFHTQYGDPNDIDSQLNATIGNPFEKGRIIDIQFQGQDGGKFDSLSFAAIHRLDEGLTYRPLGLARISFFVDNGVLMRSEEAVESKKRNQIGEVIQAPQPPLFIPLAEGVQEFNIAYSFWFDNQWYEVDTWNSTNRRIRNSQYILGDYRDNWEDERRQQSGQQGGQQGLQPGSAGWNEFINDQWSEPLDRLPATIRVTLVLADPEKGTRKQTFQRIIRVLSAEETFAPGPELTEDERENERYLRDEKYELIFPGVMDKF